MTHRDDGWNDHLKPSALSYDERANPPPLPEPDSERVDERIEWDRETEDETATTRVADAVPVDLKAISRPAVPNGGDPWPEPLPLGDGIVGDPYPADALPPIIADAVEEVRAYVKAPLAMLRPPQWRCSVLPRSPLWTWNAITVCAARVRCSCYR